MVALAQPSSATQLPPDYYGPRGYTVSYLPKLPLTLLSLVPLLCPPPHTLSHTLLILFSFQSFQFQIPLPVQTFNSFQFREQEASNSALIWKF